MPDSATPLLEMRRITKAFPGVIALSDVQFRMFPGEVHAVMGQNGAGKSTLVKVLTGVYRPDSGKILLDEKEIHPTSPRDAERLGIRAVFQEVNLCPNLSVSENIFIGQAPHRVGLVDWHTMNQRGEDAMRSLNVNVDGHRILSECSIAVQQMVAIARALAASARVLILDEPTSSLDADEVEQLFTVIRNLRDKGMTILFITHFLDQVYAIADRITVLRNGNFEGEFLPADLPQPELVARMLGRELTSEFNTQQARLAPVATPGPAVLSARGVGRASAIAPFDLDLHPGEVVGLAGLLGSGRTELARLLFGADTSDHGSFLHKGRKFRMSSPRAAIRAKIGFCSEDRKVEGVLGELTIRENILLALRGRQGIFSNMPVKKQMAIADEFIRVLGIKTPSAETEIRRLSGGNQQKVLLARWLATDPSILLLDEPTRGIDVVAKFEILQFILDLSRKGLSILLISSEFEEVLRYSHRIVVLRDRAKVTELAGDERTEHNIMSIIAGGLT